MDKPYRLKQAYMESKTDLLKVNVMDIRIIKPTTDAKDFIRLVKKAIKKRESKRLDYERFDWVSSAEEKQKRSEGELWEVTEVRRDNQ